jgi:glutamate dehydrogenase/leucine dehydrogenase
MVWNRYGTYLRRPPELTVAWHDRETEARGWLVINSLRGGAAGGGTRMRAGCEPREVVYLAKAMELKFALAGPPIGGAKTGIDFDPADPRKAGVLERWYAAIAPYLRERYGTGGDLNVDEVLDVIPTFRRLGLSHPQEGVVRGHKRPDGAGFARMIEALDGGVNAPVHGALGLDGCGFTVSDMITGYGLARSIEHYYRLQGRDLEGVRVRLEGFGNVGASCGLYLSRAGARIVAVIDAERSLVEPAGLGAPAVAELLRRREGGRLLPGDDPRIRTGPEREDGFWVGDAELFVCAALSGTITAAGLDRLEATGTKVIASGANQPFREQKMGATRIQRMADERFSIIPDVVANCGMARAFSYLMEEGCTPAPAAIFEAVDRTVADGVAEMVERAGGEATGLLAATLEMLLDRVER